tara:strand:- start:12457 stop:13137 length:681 start_codon:yes stop_codon:yes gene_type:complete
MQKLLTILLISFPLIGFSQFGVSEYYLAPRFGIGMGMNSYSYFSSVNGTITDEPIFVQMELGNGMSPEVALGFKLIKDVYVETSLGYVIHKDFYSTQSGGQTVQQGYSFNRFNLQLNGKYYVPINDKFILDFFGGIAYSIPKDLIVKIGGKTEIIRYAGSTGMQFGFGGDYVLGDISLHGGIRYRLERFTIKPNQKLPTDFSFLNPGFDNISSSGIDLIFSVQFNF